MREEVLHKVFLYLRKAYNDLYRERYMEIIILYEVGPRKDCPRHHYWEGFNVVDRAGRYYGAPFKDSRGVM